MTQFKTRNFTFFAPRTVIFLENCDCLGILSIRSVNKELYAGEMKVLEIKDLSMFREFDFVQLQGQENGLPALFMQFAEHYKEKL